MVPTSASLEDALDRARIDEATVEEVLDAYGVEGDSTQQVWLLRLRNDVFCVVYVCGRSTTSHYAPDLAQVRKRIPAGCTVRQDVAHFREQWGVSPQAKAAR